MQPTPNPKQNKPGEEIAEKAQAAYKWWDDLATLRVEDPLWLGAAKIGVRVLGILVLLAMSPLILLGFVMAFIVVA